MLETLLLGAWIGCQSLDLGTTLYALNRPGYREANPLMAGSQTKIIAIKVSVNVGAFAFNQAFIPKGRKIRYVLPSVYAGLGCLAGGINIHTLRKGR